MALLDGSYFAFLVWLLTGPAQQPGLEWGLKGEYVTVSQPGGSGDMFPWKKI